MPVQQAVDVAVPIETAYNQFTQYEDWPQFMHRVTNVSQDEPTAVSFSTKIWTRKREFTAAIETQRPDQRIMWKVSQGITHAGIVSFHELAPRLTRIELTLDVKPGSLLEKAARGMRHIKRAVRADLHRFKAFMEMQEIETGAWRGVIKDGEVVEEHDESYDEEREYSDIEDLQDESESEDQDEEEQEDEQEDEDRSEERAPSRSGGRTAAASRLDSSRSSSSGGRKRGSDDSSSRSRGRTRGATNGSNGESKPKPKSKSSRSSGSGNGKSSARSGKSSSGGRKASSRS